MLIIIIIIKYKKKLKDPNRHQQQRKNKTTREIKAGNKAHPGNPMPFDSHHPQSTPIFRGSMDINELDPIFITQHLFPQKGGVRNARYGDKGRMMR